MGERQSITRRQLADLIKRGSETKNPSEFYEAVAELVENVGVISEDSPEQIETRKAQLKDFHSVYHGEPPKFKSGDFVRWKKGFRHKKRPSYNEPVIVIEVLKPPVLDLEASAGSQYFREQLDLMLGLVDEDGDFLVYHFNSRRFELFEEQ